MPPVTVNGVAISRRAIAAEVQNFPARNPGEGWRTATRALVIRELLLQEARRLDVPIDQKTDADGRIETIEDALVRALVERKVHVPQADEEMPRRFYDNNRRRFTTAPLWEADHILIAARRDDSEGFAVARDKASALASILSQAPDRFAELARDGSDCPSAAVGGSLGQIGPGDTTPEFEVALTALTEGGISGRSRRATGSISSACGDGSTAGNCRSKPCAGASKLISASTSGGRQPPSTSRC